MEGDGLARTGQPADDNQAQFAWLVISALLINVL